MGGKHYYLVFRITQGEEIPWMAPTGGIVLRSDQAGRIQEIAAERYHCSPSEHLVIVEVFSWDEKYDARLLDKEWAKEWKEFNELMRSA